MLREMLSRLVSRSNRTTRRRDHAARRRPLPLALTNLEDRAVPATMPLVTSLGVQVGEVTVESDADSVMVSYAITNDNWQIADGTTVVTIGGVDYTQPDSASPTMVSYDIALLDLWSDGVSIASGAELEVTTQAQVETADSLQGQTRLLSLELLRTNGSNQELPINIYEIIPATGELNLLSSHSQAVKFNRNAVAFNSTAYDAENNRFYYTVAGHSLHVVDLDTGEERKLVDDLPGGELAGATFYNNTYYYIPQRSDDIYGLAIDEQTGDAGSHTKVDIQGSEIRFGFGDVAIRNEGGTDYLYGAASYSGNNVLFKVELDTGAGYTEIYPESSPTLGSGGIQIDFGSDGVLYGIDARDSSKVYTIALDKQEIKPAVTIYSPDAATKSSPLFPDLAAGPMQGEVYSFSADAMVTLPIEQFNHSCDLLPDLDPALDNPRGGLYMDESTGMLTIVGTDRGDTILIDKVNYYDRRTRSMSEKVVVRADFLRWRTYMYDASLVKSIMIYTKDGHDMVLEPTNGTFAIPTYVKDSNGSSQLHLGSGDNIVCMAEGFDNIRTGSGTGNNQIMTGHGGSLVVTHDGNDTVMGGNGFDNVETGGGHDHVEVGHGGSQIKTGAGNDVVMAGEGQDNVEAGAGHDHVDITNGGGHVKGGAGNDTILGGIGTDRLEGGDGEDMMFGFASQDFFNGGTGVDHMIGGTGNDDFESRHDGSNDYMYDGDLTSTNGMPVHEALKTGEVSHLSDNDRDIFHADVAEKESSDPIHIHFNAGDDHIDG